MNRLHSLFTLGAVVGVVGLTTALLWSPTRAAPPAQAPAEKPSAARAEGLYLENCAPCHGQTGKGDGPTIAGQGISAVDFTGPDYIRDKTPDALFDVTSNGRMDKMMPPWDGQLTASQIWDLVFYVWTLATPADRLEAGKDIYTVKCASCHGEEGLGDGPEAAGLEKQPPSFADPARLASRSQSDLFQAADDMPGHESWAALSVDDKWAVLDYARAFSYEPLGPETTDGTIAGQVTAGTAGATPDDFGGLQATLYSYRNNQPEQPITTTTDVNGEFAFEGLSTSATRQYDVSVLYKGVEYFGEQPFSFSAGDTSLAMAVPVFETTNDPSQVKLDRTHVIIDFEDSQFMRVAELYIFSNGGDRTFIGTEPVAGTDRLATLRFALPSGATDVRFEDTRMQAMSVQAGDLLTDTLPVAPGSRQVLMSYLLPYSRPDFKLVKPVVYDTTNFNVLTVDAGQSVKATGLTEREPLSPGSGVQYLNLVGQDLPAGQPVVVEFANIPATLPTASIGAQAPAATTPPPGLNQDAVKLVGIGLAAMAALLAIGYPLLRGHVRVETRPAVRQPQPDRLQLRHDELVETIGQLDDAFEAGEIDQAEYEAQRAAAKAELMRVIRQQRGLE